MPSKSLNLTIGKNDYVIKFPTNGQLIDIESFKINLTQGTHKDMVYGGPASQDAYLLVEAISPFTILIPELKMDLNVKSLLELDMSQSKAMIKSYQKYYEWMREWREYINQDDN